MTNEAFRRNSHAIGLALAACALFAAALGLISLAGVGDQIGVVFLGGWVASVAAALMIARRLNAQWLLIVGVAAIAYPAASLVAMLFAIDASCSGWGSARCPFS